MLKFYKSFLFLFSLNALVLLLGGLVLDLRFLILVMGFIFVLNAFLCFFTSFYLDKHFSFSVFPKEDFYGISKLFEQIKQNYPSSRLELLKSEGSFCLYWTVWNRSKLAVSEDFLENFPPKDREIFLSYVFRLEQSRDLVFISLFSAFLFLFQKGARILSYPLIRLGMAIRPKKAQKSGFDKASLWLFSLFMKSFLYQTDQKLLQNSEEKSQQALFLWNLDSWTRFQEELNLPLFLAPLGLANPLKQELLGYYPSIKQRIKKLTGDFPA